MSWNLAASAVKLRFEQFSRVFDRKYDPDQSRIPAGEPGAGRWTDGNGSVGSEESSAASVEGILAMAPRLAASGASMNRCVALCSPLLEAIQPRNTTNINYWNFVKCLNACLGK